MKNCTDIEDFLRTVTYSAVGNVKTDFCSMIVDQHMEKVLPIRINFYISLLCKNGSCRTTAGNHSFLLSGASLSIIPADSIFSLSDLSEDFNAQLVMFSPDFVQKGFVKADIMDELLHISTDYAPVFNLALNDFNDCLYKFNKIKAEIEQQSPFCMEVCRLYLLQILYDYNRVCELCLINSDKLINRQYQILYQFRKLTDLHFTKLKTVSEYAALMNLSPKYLSECVKEHTGTAALSLIQHRIIVESEQLLNYSTLSIKSIAFKLGFTSPATFSRFFKKNKGSSPAEYRTKP